MGAVAEVDGGLRERERALWHADEMHRLLRRHADDERLRIGHAHVLAGETDEPPHDVERVLARLQHAPQPVESGVGIGAAQRLMQRRDQVVVFLARLVVEQRAMLQRVLHACQINHPRAGLVSLGAVVAASSSALRAVRASPLA